MSVHFFTSMRDLECVSDANFDLECVSNMSFDFEEWSAF